MSRRFCNLYLFSSFYNETSTFFLYLDLMLRQNLTKAIPNGASSQFFLHRSLLQQSRALPGFPIMLIRDASTYTKKYNDKPAYPKKNDNASTHRSKNASTPPHPSKQRLVQVDSPFASANKLLYVLPTDPYFASEKVSRILEIGTVEDAAEYVMALPAYLQSAVVWNQLIGYCAKYGKSNFAEKYYSQVKQRRHR